MSEPACVMLLVFGWNLEIPVKPQLPPQPAPQQSRHATTARRAGPGGPRREYCGAQRSAAGLIAAACPGRAALA